MKKYFKLALIGAFILGVSGMQAQEKSKLTLKASKQLEADKDDAVQTMDNKTKEIKKEDYKRMMKEARTEEERAAIKQKYEAQERAQEKSKKIQGQARKAQSNQLHDDQKASRKGGGEQKKKMSQ